MRVGRHRATSERQLAAASAAGNSLTECASPSSVQGQQRNWKVVDPTVLIPGILSKIRPRNSPDQSYVRFITDSGPHARRRRLRVR